MSDKPFWNAANPADLGFLPDTKEEDSSSLDDLFSENPSTPPGPPVVLPEPETSPAPAPLFSAPAPSPAPVKSFPPPTATDPADARRKKRQESMEAMRNAASTMTQDEMDLAGQREAFNRRMDNMENLFLYADQIQTFVSKDAELNKMVAEFELTSDYSQDRQQRTLFEREVRPRLAEGNVQIGNPQDIQAIFELAYNEIIGISVLGDLWRDPTVDEILIDRWDKIVVERFGNLQDTPYRFRSPLHAQRVARQLSQVVSDRSVSPANPIPTAVLPSARVQFAWGQIVGGGLAITIRKFKDLMDMSGILAKGSLSEEMRDFLSDAVRARASILISGGVGTGKTTMINALSGFIPNTERVVTIEDAFELQLANRHVVSLQSKPRSRLEDAVEITMEDLMVATLRMRPDRIVVGEIREPAAAATMIQAATTGHDGTLTTVHATSSSIALNSRVARFLARSSAGYSEASALEEVSLAFDLVIQIRKTLGMRYISEIALVDPTLVTTRIQPVILFSGHLNDQKTAPVFARVAPLPPSTLQDKMLDEGIDIARWTTL